MSVMPPRRRLSIAVKLPLGLAILLAVALGALTFTAYLQVRASVIALASERLDRAARQMGELMASSTRQRQAALAALIDRSKTGEYLRNPSPALAESVASALRAYVGSTSILGVEVWDQDGHRLIASSPALGEMPHDQAVQLEADAARGAVGGAAPYRASGRELTYAFAVPVRDDEVILGYIVERRRMAGSPQAQALLGGLIGGDATLLIGNAAGDVWTDLVAPVEPPPVDMSRGQLFEYERSGRPAVLARAAAVAGTPWRVAVEFPKSQVNDPVRRFLMRALGVLLVVVIGGATAGWLFSRRLTTPLRQVTEAAEAIAGGQLATPIALDRADELGRLAVSFNAMAAQVAESRRGLESHVDALEHRVSERTVELQDANRELEAFASSVSHDLRAPARAVGDFARLIAADHAGQMPPAVEEAFGVIARDTTDMVGLIDGLLVLSRLGREPISRSPIDMRALAYDVIDDLRRKGEGACAEVVVHALPPAEGEPLLVKQLLVNLLQNGLKFTRPRAQARIDVAWIECDGVTAYYVRDNGVGFDMAHAGRLFSRFQRLHSADQFEGTGIGLAIVERVVRRHGGRVWAEGAVDKGATFFFTLAPPPEPPGAAVSEPRGN